MTLGTEVGLGPGYILLDWDPFLLWPNRWMHQDASRYAGRPQPRRVCVRWGPSPLSQKGAEPPPQF